MLPTVLRSIVSRSSSSRSAFSRARGSRTGRALSLGLALASSVAAIALIAGPSTAAPPVATVLASARVGTTAEAGRQSSGASISADGNLVAFLSRATNLVPGFVDNNGASGDDAYLLERSSGAIVLVSGATPTSGANADVYRVQVARAGRFVVFNTTATNVVVSPVVAPGNTNRHVYRYDRQAPTATVMVDVTPAGAPGGGTADDPTASDDGGFVAFDSTADDLVTDQVDSDAVTNPSYDVFLRDMNAVLPSTGMTIVSHLALLPASALAATDPQPLIDAQGLKHPRDGYGSRAPSLSADGCFVVFYTRANLANLNPAITDSTGLPDVVRLSRCGAGDVFELVSHRDTSTPGAPVSANQWSDDATVSADGNWVVFETHATNLVTDVNDVNGGNEDVYLRDIAGAQTHLISADFNDPTTTTDGYSDTASWLGPSGRMVSDDGRYVVFQSRSNTAYPGLADPKVNNGTDPRNWPEDTFVRDRLAPGGPTTIPVSVNAAGTAFGNDTSYVTHQGSPTISGDGQVVVWNSEASDLVAGDTNNAADVFVRGVGVVPPPPPPPPPPPGPPPPPLPPPAPPTPAPPAAPPPATTPATTPPVVSGSGGGYWMASDDGQVFGFGPGATLADDAPTPAAGVVYVDLEPRPQGDGYWLLDSTGLVTNRGRAGLLSARPNLLIGESATSLSATPTGLGYWIFTTRGRVLRFGDALPLGDLSNVVLNGPVLDSVATPSGLGYYMVGSDGGVFAFGDAMFYGSTGDQRLNKPVQSLVPTATNRGYWLVASDGGVFAFGDAVFRGSMGSVSLNRPVTGMVRFGSGYLMVGEDGGIFNFSDLPFFGSLGATPPARPIVAVAPVP